MIVDLPDTTVSKIARSLVSVREEGGAVALGRVLTLVIVTTHGLQEEAIEAANDASREHPMRVIVLIALASALFFTCTYVLNRAAADGALRALRQGAGVSDQRHGLAAQGLQQFGLRDRQPLQRRLIAQRAGQQKAPAGHASSFR